MRQPASYAGKIGTGEYYNLRHADFLRRHGDLEPPPYYLQYGLRYFERFQALSDKLSDEGKGWVVRTARLLQESIEARRKRSPRSFDALERHPRRFQDFAYGTHRAAYIKAGLQRLPPEDVVLVASAPDAQDLLSDAGIRQVVETALEAIAKNGPTRNAAFVAEAMVDLAQYTQRRAADAADAFERELDDVGGQLDGASGKVVAAVEEGTRTARRLFARVKGAVEVPWVMHQTWRNPVFCSWRVRPEALRPLVPARLQLDLFEGSPWVSMVPLEMASVYMIRPPSLPFDTFAEVNLRTYVRFKGKPGVYFLSLECGQEMVDFVGKWMMGLPYRSAEVSIRAKGTEFRCTSKRGKAVLDCSYRPDGPLATAPRGSVESWLTERYAMYVVEKPTGRLLRGEVKHDPWKLRAATVDIAANTLWRAVGLPIKGPPDHVGFSPGVSTEAYPFVAAG
jgi:uncharacterized protein YqjF (DUF2071 family)